MIRAFLAFALAVVALGASHVVSATGVPGDRTASSADTGAWSPAPPAPPSDTQVRHSGTIVSVAPDGRSFTMEELGVAGREVRRTVTLTPDASIRLVRRSSDMSGGTAIPGWESSAIEPSQLAPGDFVTVTVRKGQEGNAVAALSLQVIRPEPAAGTEPSASPSTSSGTPAAR